MDAFLKELAESLLSKWGNRLHEVHVVLPTRRACLYFRRYLSEAAQQALLSPSIMAMDEFVRWLSGLELIDRVPALAGLYECYRRFDKTAAHTFDSFLPFGEALLKDFSTIDKNITPEKAQELFEFLDEAKAIERWSENNLGKDVKTDGDNHLKAYFSFWKYASATFFAYREELIANYQAYSGLAYRHVSEHAIKLAQERSLFHAVFAGFNQMSHSEEEIIRHLHKDGKASIIWDADNFYLKNKHYEAGHFMRRYMQSGLMGNADFQREKLFRQQGQEIRFFAVNNKVEQAKAAGALLGSRLQELLGESPSAEARRHFGMEVNRIAILLPDESLLPALLRALPTQADGCPIDLGGYTNISMGISMVQSPIYSLIEGLFRVQEHLLEEKGEVWLYFKDFLRLVTHAMTQASCGEHERAVLAKVQQEMYADNRSFIALHDLPLADELAKATQLDWEGAVALARARSENAPAYEDELFDRLKKLEEKPWASPYSVLFTFWNNSVDKAMQQLDEVVGWLLQRLLFNSTSATYEFVLALFRILRQIAQAFEQLPEKPTLPMLRQFLFEALRPEAVPFAGEPLTPIQIMGMLESRALDFEHIILLSCNEGTLPPGKRPDSLIPFDIRKEVGIPTHQESDSAIAYLFYRLFHRAKRLDIFYVQGSSAEEPSRFVAQLEALSKQPKEAPGLRIQRPIVAFSHEEGMNTADGTWAVEKTAERLELIKKWLEKRVSPSGLNSYCANPLVFFEENVMGFREGKSIDEQMGADTFGTLIHTYLELLWMPYKQKWVRKADMERICGDEALHESVMKQAVQKELGKGGAHSRGENVILVNVAKKLIREHLQQQLKVHEDFFIVGLEEPLSKLLPIGGHDFSAKLFGIADRIDCLENGTLRVIDYKTGTYNKKHLKASQRKDLLPYGEAVHTGKLFQLLLYKYLARHTALRLPKNWTLQEIEAGFIFFKNLKDGFIKYSLGDEPVEDVRAFNTYVEELLQCMIAHLLNPDFLLANEPADFTGFFEDNLE